MEIEHALFLGNFISVVSNCANVGNVGLTMLKSFHDMWISVSDRGVNVMMLFRPSISMHSCFRFV